MKGFDRDVKSAVDSSEGAAQPVVTHYLDSRMRPTAKYKECMDRRSKKSSGPLREARGWRAAGFEKPALTDDEMVQLEDRYQVNIYRPPANQECEADSMFSHHLNRISRQDGFDALDHAAVTKDGDWLRNLIGWCIREEAKDSYAVYRLMDMWKRWDDGDGVCVCEEWNEKDVLLRFAILGTDYGKGLRGIGGSTLESCKFILDHPDDLALDHIQSRLEAALRAGDIPRIKAGSPASEKLVASLARWTVETEKFLAIAQFGQQDGVEMYERFDITVQPVEQAAEDAEGEAGSRTPPPTLGNLTLRRDVEKWDESKRERTHTRPHVERFSGIAEVRQLAPAQRGIHIDHPTPSPTPPSPPHPPQDSLYHPLQSPPAPSLPLQPPPPLPTQLQPHNHRLQHGQPYVQPHDRRLKRKEKVAAESPLSRAVRERSSKPARGSSAARAAWGGEKRAIDFDFRKVEPPRTEVVLNLAEQRARGAAGLAEHLAREKGKPLTAAAERLMAMEEARAMEDAQQEEEESKRSEGDEEDDDEQDEEEDGATKSKRKTTKTKSSKITDLGKRLLRRTIVDDLGPSLRTPTPLSFLPPTIRQALIDGNPIDLTPEMFHPFDNSAVVAFVRFYHNVFGHGHPTCSAAVDLFFARLSSPDIPPAQAKTIWSSITSTGRGLKDEISRIGCTVGERYQEKWAKGVANMKAPEKEKLDRRLEDKAHRGLIFRDATDATGASWVGMDGRQLSETEIRAVGDAKMTVSVLDPG